MEKNQKQTLKRKSYLTETLFIRQTSGQINCVSLALNNTILLLKEQMFTWKFQLVHIASNSSTLWRIKLQHPVYQFSMLNPKQAIIANKYKNLIQIYDLETRQIKTVPHHFSAFGQNSSIQVFVFPQTNFICIVEEQLNELWLTYYSYSGISEKSKAKATFHQSCNSGTIKKLNNHSKIGWIKRGRRGNQFQFHFFALTKHGHSSIHSSLIITRSLFSGLLVPEYNIFPIWEIRPREYLIKAPPFKNTMDISSHKKTALYRLIHTTNEDNEDQVSLKQQIFSFNGRHMNVSLFSSKQCYIRGPLLVMVDSVANEDGQSRIMFIDGQKRQIVEIHQKTKGETSYWTTQWCNDIFLQSLYQFSTHQLLVKITHCRMPPIIMLYLHLLLHINQDFDDDLLYDAVDMLVQL